MSRRPRRTAFLARLVPLSAAPETADALLKLRTVANGEVSRLRMKLINPTSPAFRSMPGSQPKPSV